MFFFYYNPILIAAAIIPAVFLLVRIYRADRLEKEPPKLLLSLVFWGIVSTTFAAAAEGFGIAIAGRLWPEGSLTYNAVVYFGVVACSEEGFKYLFLRRRTWRAPEFNCRFDAVVYSVFVSLGFALWENIQYVLSFGLGTALIRAITAVPGHACFGVFMGVWYGLAKREENYGNAQKSRHYSRMAFLLPALAHGCYDFFATMEQDVFSLIFVAFIAVMFIAAFASVKRHSSGDQYID